MLNNSESCWKPLLHGGQWWQPVGHSKGAAWPVPHSPCTEHLWHTQCWKQPACPRWLLPSILLRLHSPLGDNLFLATVVYTIAYLHIPYISSLVQFNLSFYSVYKGLSLWDTVPTDKRWPSEPPSVVFLPGNSEQMTSILCSLRSLAVISFSLHQALFLKVILRQYCDVLRITLFILICLLNYLCLIKRLLNGTFH